MSDNEDYWSGATADGTQVVCKTEDGPVVFYGAEVGVFGISQHTVVDKLCTDDDVLTSLIRRANGLRRV